jgi:Uma2 family endonuclease
MADTITRAAPIAQISPKAVRWTRKDCDALERAGVLDYRYELVEGVINKMGQNLGHANAIRLLIGWLVATFGIDFFFVQTTIDVHPADNPTSAPEPDGIVLNRPAGGLAGVPTPADIRLLIEASDSTLNYDLTVKAALYARAQIPEYWVVSLPERRLYVHRRPEGGVYRNIASYGEHDMVSPFDDASPAVAVSALLPDSPE